MNGGYDQKTRGYPMKSSLALKTQREPSFTDSTELPPGSVILEQTSEEAAETIEFLAQISQEKGWQPPPGALEAYPERSVFLVHRDESGILGALKLVCGGVGSHLPVMQIWPEFGLDNRAGIAELSVLALNSCARGRQAFLPLTAAVWRYCMSRGINELWAELEPRMLAVYRRFGWPFEVMGELREYWGDPLYPCRLFGEDWLEEHVARADKSPRYLTALKQAVQHTVFEEIAAQRLPELGLALQPSEA